MTQRRRHRSTRGRPGACRPRPTARLRVRGAEDFVELIPYLLGFHPVDSLVMMFIRDGEVQLTARADLATGVESLRAVARQAACRCRAQLLFLAAYSAAPSVAGTLLALVQDPVMPAIVDAVRVEDRRWWSVLDDDQGELAGTGRLAAEAVFAGLAAAPTRADAVAAAAPPAATDLAALTVAADRQRARVSTLTATARIDEAVSIVTRRLGGGLGDGFDGGHGDATPWARDERLRLAALVDGDVAVRDALLLRTTRDNAPSAVRLWSQVVGCAPPGYEVAPLCLLGLAAWQCGNGALMAECINRAGAADPGCTLVRLLAQILDAALPPDAWSRVAADITGGGHR